jgi:DNA-directed RNA polymerase subunit M/transcription elongation factor TFIIS
VLTAEEIGNDVFLVCGNCGYKKEASYVEHKCTKCGCDRAFVHYHGATRGDEDDLIFYTCVRCGSVEREGYAV